MMVPFKCGANAVVFANRPTPLVVVVQKLHGACQPSVCECSCSSDRHINQRLAEGQGRPCITILGRSKLDQYNDSFRHFVRTFSTSRAQLTVHVDKTMNYYSVLGVTPQCSGVKIKQAYYRLSKIYHPDVNKTETAVKKFHEVTEAYEILSNPELRHQYDLQRHGHKKSHGHGHVRHGVNRGVQSGPVNFKAKGPHQQVRAEHYNVDEWLKEHYSESYQKRLNDMKKKQFYDRLERDIERHNSRYLDLVRKKYYKKTPLEHDLDRSSHINVKRYGFMTVIAMLMIALTALRTT